MNRAPSNFSAALEKRASEFNIILEDVSITHLMFSKEFTTAIESKQVAQQDAERQKFVVLKAEQEKKAAIIRAEGEGEAADLISAVRLGRAALVVATAFEYNPRHPPVYIHTPFSNMPPPPLFVLDATGAERARCWRDRGQAH